MASDKSPFSDPLPGERMIRRVINEVARSVGTLPSEHRAAVNTRAERIVNMFTKTRLNLEEAVNNLRSLTSVPADLIGRVEKAINTGQRCLGDHPPWDPAQVPLNDDAGVGLPPVPPLPAAIDAAIAAQRPLNQPAAQAPQPPLPQRAASTGHIPLNPNLNSFRPIPRPIPRHPASPVSTVSTGTLATADGEPAIEAEAPEGANHPPPNLTQVSEARRQQKLKLQAKKAEQLKRLEELQKQMDELEVIEDDLEVERIIAPPNRLQDWLKNVQGNPPNPPHQPNLPALNPNQQLVQPVFQPALQPALQPVLQPVQPATNFPDQPFSPPTPPVVPNPAAVMNQLALQNPQVPYGGDVASSLLTVNLRSHGRDLLISSRPPKDKRFSGDDGRDFESFMNQYNLAMKVEGVTDQMRFTELQHWVTGTASLIVCIYENEVDPSVALKKAKKHLKIEFGRKVFTARQMLEDLLAGPKINRDDSAAIRVFIIKLKNVYLKAVETKRDHSFNAPETYGDILRRKLPFFTQKWAQRTVDNEKEFFEADDDADHSLTFVQFLEYLTRQNSINLHRSAILKTNETSTNSNQNKPSQGTQNPKRNQKGNATVTIAATATSTPQPSKKQKPQSKPEKKSFSAAAAASAAAAPAKKDGEGHQKAPPTKKGECLACNNGVHEIVCCREFLKLNDADKRVFVKSKGLCFLCLKRGHMSASCPEEIACDKCGDNKHNTVFHRVKNSDKGAKPEEV